jgi:hypothetical protein
MPIRFKCPSCKKPLSAKEHMAGKKAVCTACKKPLVIPAPLSNPADVENFAATLLAESPAAAKVEEKPKSTQTIDFNCPFCEAELHLSAELGGKREPCPECKNIIKVPQLVKEQAKDWRTVEKTGPSGAAGKAQPQLAGAWGSTTNKGKVSMQALEDADAIIYEDDEEQSAVGRWIKRVTIFAGVGGLIFLAIWGINRRQDRKQQKDSIDHALEYVEKAKDKLPGGWNAEIYRAAGEFYLAKKDKPSFDLAQTYLKRARGQILILAKDNPALDFDLLLARLALAQIDQGGTDAEADFDKTRIKWNDVHEELWRTLQGIGSVDGQIQALRALADKLVSHQQGFRATLFAGRLYAKNEKATALYGQRIAFLHDPDMKMDKIEELKAEAAKKVPPPKPGQRLDALTRIAYAEAAAREGNSSKALEIAQAPGGSPQDLLEAALAVALVGLARNKSSAECGLDLAIQLEDNAPPWPRLQLVEAAARAGMLKEAKEIAKKLPAAFKSWGELKILQANLTKNQGLADAALVEDISNKDSLPRALAWEAWARHNTRLGFKDAVNAAREQLGDSRFRPFIDVGIALGVQDRAGK